MTNGLKKEDSAALKGLAVLLLIFHHCYRLADRIERYQVDLCGLTTEQLVAIAECCKICVAIFAFVSGYGLMYGYSAKMKNKEKYIGLYDKNTDRTYNYPIKIFQDQLKVGELNYFSIGSVDDYHVAPLDVLSLKDMAGNGYVFDDKLSELLTISNEEDNSILLFVRIKK